MISTVCNLIFMEIDDELIVCSGATPFFHLCAVRVKTVWITSLGKIGPVIAYFPGEIKVVTLERTPAFCQCFKYEP